MQPRRTLVLLPGMEGSGIVFRPLVATAPADVELVTLTYPSGEAQSYDALLPLARALLPRDRPFHLLGWSFVSRPHPLPARQRGPCRSRALRRRDPRAVELVDIEGPHLGLLTNNPVASWAALSAFMARTGGAP